MRNSTIGGFICRSPESEESLERCHDIHSKVVRTGCRKYFIPTIFCVFFGERSTFRQSVLSIHVPARVRNFHEEVKLIQFYLRSVILTSEFLGPFLALSLENIVEAI